MFTYPIFSAAQSPAAPLTIPGLVLWLDAADRGATANRWDDKSGEENHFTNNAGAVMPVFSGGEAQFNGLQRFQGGAFSGLSSGEIFALVYSDSDTAARSLWDWSVDASSNNQSHYAYGQVIYEGFGSTARKTVGNPAPTLVAYRTINIWSAPGDWSYRLDGSTLHSTASNTVGFPATAALGYGRDSRGSVFDEHFYGKIKSICLFNRKLSASERTEMLDYMGSL